MIAKENPCFGCVAQMPDGEIRRGSCCWDIDEFVVSEQHYQEYFCW